MSAALQGAGTARGVNLSAVLPSGLTPVLAAPRSCPLTAAFTCALGDLGAGSREAVVVVRGTKTGTYAVAVGATSTTPDPNPANNVATVAIKVVTTTKGCKVPSLKGRKKAFASALLKAAGCKLGTTKRKRIKKGKSGRVIAQGKKAGSVVPAGTRVAITLSKRRT
jgi:hypothetical protein